MKNNTTYAKETQKNRSTTLQEFPNSTQSKQRRIDYSPSTKEQWVPGEPDLISQLYLHTDPDVLIKIFALLPDEELLRAVYTVSKQWRDIFTAGDYPLLIPIIKQAYRQNLTFQARVDFFSDRLRVKDDCLFFKSAIWEVKFISRLQNNF